MGTYYTTDNTLQWELVLNDHNAPLGTIQVIDQLPEGMQYVPGSARLDGQPISETDAGDNGNYVSQEGQSIIFHLNNIQAKQYRVLFTTAVDPNASVVTQNKQVRFKNQAAVKVWSESDQKWIQTATASETATLNYSVLKKDVIQTSGSDNGVREARYRAATDSIANLQTTDTVAESVNACSTLNHTAGSFRIPGSFMQYDLTRVRWEKAGASITIPVSADLSQVSYLQIDLAQDSGDERNRQQDQSMTVALRDANDQNVSVQVEAGTPALTWQKGTVENIPISSQIPVFL